MLPVKVTFYNERTMGGIFAYAVCFVIVMQTVCVVITLHMVFMQSTIRRFGMIIWNCLQGEMVLNKHAVYIIHTFYINLVATGNCTLIYIDQIYVGLMEMCNLFGYSNQFVRNLE